MCAAESETSTLGGTEHAAERLRNLLSGVFRTRTRDWFGQREVQRNCGPNTGHCRSTASATRSLSMLLGARCAAHS